MARTGELRSPEQAHHKCDGSHHQEYEEQNFRDARSTRRESAEAENSRDDCN